MDKNGQYGQKFIDTFDLNLFTQFVESVSLLS